MVGMNLMKICQAVVSVRISPDTLPTKEKLNYDNESHNKKNINKRDDKRFNNRDYSLFF